LVVYDYENTYVCYHPLLITEVNSDTK
jgi:hypothetical protein